MKLLWEIGKSATDSEREFDRAVDHIRATRNVRTDMDPNSTRFTSSEGIIGPPGVMGCTGPFNYPLNGTFCLLIPPPVMVGLMQNRIIHCCYARLGSVARNGVSRRVQRGVTLENRPYWFSGQPFCSLRSPRNTVSRYFAQSGA